MRLIAVVLNILLIVGVGYLLIINGLPGRGEVFALLLVIGAPTASLIALYTKAKTEGAEKGWLSLYLKRKSLEEKKKIKELSNS